MLLAASPVPSVDLSASELPRDGLLITRSKFCDRRFGPECKRHYAALATGPKLIPVQCPFGFASIALPDAGPGFALTGFVPFPRIGGDAERARAKECPSGRVDTGVLVAWSKSLASAQALLRERESQALSSHLEALHEVRRLNHTVKVIMERLCTKAAPGNPDRAPSDLVRGWKASEMISHHLDALDILSNPGLAETPPNKVITFYKLVDRDLPDLPGPRRREEGSSSSRWPLRRQGLRLRRHYPHRAERFHGQRHQVLEGRRPSGSPGVRRCARQQGQRGLRGEKHGTTRQCCRRTSSFPPARTR